MSYTTKRKIMNSSVYIVLGLVITAVLCVTIATFAGMRNKKKPAVTDTPTPDASVGILSTPSKNRPSKLPPASSGASKKDPSKSDGKNTPVIDPVKPVLYLPLEGGMQKGYSPSQPVYSLTMNDYRTHDGIDISAPIGTAVASIGDGTVADVYNDPMMGMCVCIDHGNGLVSIYKNLANTLPEGIARGADVKAGQTIGAVGDTSLIELAEAEHLHFEMTLNGKHIDPASYLDLSTLVTDKGDD